MTRLLRDARFGLRLLRRNPGFTAVAVITLALGISATTAIFSVVYGTFFAPLPYRDADALVMLWSQFRGDRVPVATRDFLEWKRQATSFSDLNAWGLADVVVATAAGPESLQAGLPRPVSSRCWATATRWRSVARFVKRKARRAAIAWPS